MANWLVRHRVFRTASEGDTTPIGPIVITPENSDWAVVDVQDEATLKALIESGDVEAMPENTFKPLGEIQPTDTNIMGNDFPVIGVTPEWQASVDGGKDCVIGICDTGHPTQAAHDAHFPGVDIVPVFGTTDTHGHETFCVSRMVGPRGVLPACSKVISAQALPNGSGSTTTVVQALRACRGATPRPDVISLSLGGPRDPVIDAEVQACTAAGVPCSVAIGNDGPGASIGTPAAVAPYVWGATTFDGQAPASFSTGGCNLPEETAAIPGDNVGGAHLDGGYGIGSGTSFSCPVGSALVAAYVRKGYTAL